MDDLEKVETIRTKCNVSYTDAKAALDAADGNVFGRHHLARVAGQDADHIGARRHRVRAGR